MADNNGVASGKILIAAELIDNFKEIGSKLKTGIGNAFKNIDLNVSFNNEKIKNSAEKELEVITKILSTKGIQKVDLSAIMPSFVDAIRDKNLSDEIKLQIIQGFREGIEDALPLLSSLGKDVKSEDVFKKFRESLAVSDIINSTEGLTKAQKAQRREYFTKKINEELFDEQRKTIQGLIATQQMSRKKGFEDVIKYFSSGNETEKETSDFIESVGKKLKEGNANKEDATVLAGYLKRMQYIASLNTSDSPQARAYRSAAKQAQDIITALEKESGFKEAMDAEREKVWDASVLRDKIYHEIDRSKIMRIAQKSKSGAVQPVINSEGISQYVENALLDRLKPMFERGVSAENLQTQVEIDDIIKEIFSKPSTMTEEQLDRFTEEQRRKREIQRRRDIQQLRQDKIEQAEAKNGENAQTQAEILQEQIDKLTKEKGSLQSYIDNKNTLIEELESANEEIQTILDENEDPAEIMNSENERIQEWVEKILWGDTNVKRGDLLIEKSDDEQSELDEAVEITSELLEERAEEQEAAIRNLEKEVEDHTKRVEEIDELIDKLTSQKAKIKKKETKGSAVDSAPSGTAEALKTEADSLAQENAVLQAEGEQIISEMREISATLNGLENTKHESDVLITDQLSSILGQEHFVKKIRAEHGILSSQREQDSLKNELQRITKDRETLQDFLDTDLSTGGKRASKNQLRDKKEAFNRAFSEYQSGGDLNDPQDRIQRLYTYQKAWIEYYKAYQEAIKQGADPNYINKNKIPDEIEEANFSDANFTKFSKGLGQSAEKYQKFLEEAYRRQEQYTEDQRRRLQTLQEKEAEVANTLTVGDNETLQQKIEENKQTIEQIETLKQQFADKRKRLAEIEQIIQQNKEKIIESATKSKKPETPEVPVEQKPETPKKTKTVSDAPEQVENLAEAEQTHIETGAQSADASSQAAEAHEAEGEAAREAAESERELANARKESASTPVKPGQQTSVSNDTNAIREKGEAAEESAGQLNNLTQAENSSTDASQNRTESLRKEKEAQDNLNRSRSEASAKPIGVETPAETPAVTGTKDESDAADGVDESFRKAAEAKREFANANKDVFESTVNSIKGIQEEIVAASNINAGFDPEKLQSIIDATAQIQGTLTSFSTSISQLGNNTDTESLNQIAESIRQISDVLSTLQTNGGLNFSIDITSLVTQFETLNDTILRLADSFSQVVNTIGIIDNESDIPDLITQVNSLVKSMETLSGKEFGFSINVGKGNTIAEQGAKTRQTLSQLEEQYNLLDDFFKKYYGLQGTNKSYSRMLSEEFGVDSNGDSYAQLFARNAFDMAGADSMTGRIEALLPLVKSLSEYAQKAGADLNTMFASYKKSPEEAVKENQVYALTSSPSEQLKQMFGGANTEILNEISNKLQEIIGLLGQFRDVLSSTSDTSGLANVQAVFEQIPVSITEAINKILELKQQVDTKAIEDQINKTKEQIKITQESLEETKKALQEEQKLRQQNQRELEAYKKKEADRQQQEISNESQKVKDENKALKDQESKRALEDQKALNKYREEQQKQQNRLELQEQARREKEAKAEKQAAEAKAKAAFNKEDESLSKEFTRYKSDWSDVFNAKSIQEQDQALAHLAETRKRVLDKNILQTNGQDIFSASIPKDYSKSLENQLAQARGMEKNRAEFIADLTDNYEKQISKMGEVSNNYSPDFITTWSDEQRTGFETVATSIETAKTALEEYREIILSIRAGTFDFSDQSSMNSIFAAKNNIPTLIKEAQSQSNNFEKKVSEANENAISKLDEVQSKLETIKAGSEELLTIDPSLQVALGEVETHLEKINQLKEILNNSPVSILNKDFSTNLDNYLQQLNGTKQQPGIIGEAQGFLTDSKTGFNRVATYYNNYGTALNKLFNDLRQGSSTSLGKIISQMAVIDEYANKLVAITGLNRGQLLTGELGDNATQKMEDAQFANKGKVSTGFESYVTYLQEQIQEAEYKLNNLLNNTKFENFGENFGGASTQGFDEFKKKIEEANDLLKRMKEEHEEVEKKGIEYFNVQNLTEAKKVFEDIFTIIDNKEIRQQAVNFSIKDNNSIQKARADMAQFMRSNPALTSGQIGQINGYIEQLQSGINSVDFNNIIAGFENVKQKAIEAGNTGSTFFSELQTRFKNLGVYLLSFVSFYRVIGVFKDGIGIIRELDDALTEMNKVSDESLNTLQKYQKETFDTAGKIGTTAVQLQKSTADFMRLGQSLQKASESAQTANILLNVSEFTNIEDATTALIAMTAAYEDAANGIGGQEIVDRLNLVGNNYAISTDQLATALQDSASALTTSGNSLDEAISLLTAGNAVVQNATVVGRFLPKDNYIG